ncbi:MAG: ATP synthase F0 subunit B [Microgenomates group bacterium]
MDIQLTQILFQLVNFSVVLGALTYLLYKPVLKIFDERARRIHEGQKAAEEAIETQNNIEEMKKEATTALKRERSRLLKEAQAEADAQKSALLEEANRTASVELEKKKAAWVQ